MPGRDPTSGPSIILGMEPGIEISSFTPSNSASTRIPTRMSSRIPSGSEPEGWLWSRVRFISEDPVDGTSGA